MERVIKYEYYASTVYEASHRDSWSPGSLALLDVHVLSYYVAFLVFN